MTTPHAAIHVLDDAGRTRRACRLVRTLTGSLCVIVVVVGSVLVALALSGAHGYEIGIGVIAWMAGRWRRRHCS
jgi:hypothetical protein